MALTKPSHPEHHLSTLSRSDFPEQPQFFQESPDSLATTSLTDSQSSPEKNPSIDSLPRVRSNSKQRQSTLSTTSSRSSRTNLLTFAALARDKTTSAIATFSDPVTRAQVSRKNSHNHRTDGDSDKSPKRKSDPSRSITPQAKESQSITTPRSGLQDTEPPSQSYEDTDANTPTPMKVVAPERSTMHQTSSRLLRMTEDDRPFTRDFKDLFATLIVSLPLESHRRMFNKCEHSFLSEEAINNLGSLKFSQSNRMPDPKDPSRIVTTTTTTTFSMARDMARTVCQRFVDARFIESADSKQIREFNLKGTLWQLTPKGIQVLDHFCSRNGIQQRHVVDLINSPKNTMQLVVLERDSVSDEISHDRGTVEVLFRRFIGANGPNIKSSVSAADSDSLSEYNDGLAGVRMACERKIGSPQRTVLQSFTGKAAVDWLLDCCTTVDKSETMKIAGLFLEHDLLWCVLSDRSYTSQSPAHKFQPTKMAIYQMTQKGKDIINMSSTHRLSNGDVDSPSSRIGVSRDSNTQKLDRILTDAALRLLFREQLRDTHCEENLSFYLDVDEFLKTCTDALQGMSPSSRAKNPDRSLDAIKETMASAYGIYNAFLAPGSPCELNIDHLLRSQLASRMTKAVGRGDAMIESLKEVIKLFEEAQLSVFKLMASDSVPKFMKSVKYEQTLKNYDFDSIPAHPAPGQSRSHGSVNRSSR
ncbi:hypothetical protein VC83_02109 [Pseudogymnoascus destructans]|uniref:Developmental regulator flbA n=2 Tax=Pseudogymnoascus destructans TaxID=655981 RepID=L8G2N2_PSED2|nr:uncharacterized protein VC83_02109 [Pseudogymnoascus destructans]ELR07510.1 hypothetical protein, variant [Pseudogymnoascus destructans 20631-21]ELR07511.1 hypothetical protein GMDG_02602 [Pseudogymnoascus destructans 20631-21]OAF61703.1 hypothetical protein VC83_02109 [Pseudogymnoascus destructans]